MIQSTAIPLPIDNIDTDQIIPARFLKATDRSGFGENLFCDWRYLPDGSPMPDFVLNDPTYSGQILIAGKNFGCGSSREHAAWALADFGFKVVVSSFFADIFKGNALNNQILPVQLPEEVVQSLLALVEAEPSTAFKVNLEKQTFSLVNSGETYTFDIDPYKKMCLMEGYTDLSFLRSLDQEISTYEASSKF